MKTNRHSETPPFDPSDDNLRTQIADADLIIGVGSETKEELLLFGAHHLRRIVDKNESEKMDTLLVSYRDNYDLAQLLCQITEIKGFSDFEAA